MKWKPAIFAGLVSRVHYNLPQSKKKCQCPDFTKGGICLVWTSFTVSRDLLILFLSGSSSLNSKQEGQSLDNALLAKMLSDSSLLLFTVVPVVWTAVKSILNNARKQTKGGGASSGWERLPGDGRVIVCLFKAARTSAKSSGERGEEEEFKGPWVGSLAESVERKLQCPFLTTLGSHIPSPSSNSLGHRRLALIQCRRRLHMGTGWRR